MNHKPGKLVVFKGESKDKKAEFQSLFSVLVIWSKSLSSKGMFAFLCQPAQPRHSNYNSWFIYLHLQNIPFVLLANLVCVQRNWQHKDSRISTLSSASLFYLNTVNGFKMSRKKNINR